MELISNIKTLDELIKAYSFKDTEQIYTNGIELIPVFRLRQFIESRPKGEWIDNSEYGYVECPFCHEATTCDDNIDELRYCWNCGAEMENE